MHRHFQHGEHHPHPEEHRGHHGFGHSRHHHGPGGPGGPHIHHERERFGRGEGRRGPWWEGQGRPRARRGDVRSAVLALLSEGPNNGYGLISQISERSGGAWQPSPGSIYPALQLLEDEGLIAAAEGEGKRLYSLTDAGRAYVEAHREELSAVWSTISGSASDSVAELRTMIKQVAVAVMQVAGAGTDAQIAEAQRLLKQTRRALYGILAADDQADESAKGGTESTQQG